MTETVADRARRRIREEMDREHLNQTDIAGILKWGQSQVSKLLNGHTRLDVNDLDALCFAVGIRITEAVRDHGLEFCAELTPTELRILERIRQLTEPVREGLMGLLDVSPHTRLETRGVTKSTQGRMKKVR